MRRSRWLLVSLVVLSMALVMGCSARRPDSANPGPGGAQGGPGETEPGAAAGATPGQPGTGPGAGGASGAGKPGEGAGGAGAGSAAAPSPEVDRTDWPVIVAFGDSLTAGKDVLPEESYPSRLQAELDRLGYRYRVVNAGVSGDTTYGGLARVAAVLAHRPQIVILELGANDGLRGMEIDKMEQNLAAIIERLREGGATVILAGMEVPPNYGPDYTRQFREVFPRLAERYDLPLIPFFLEGVAGNPELNLADGVHPTGEGYRLVVQNVLAVLEPLLEK